jgi:ketosteroid isomerase-like protein
MSGMSPELVNLRVREFWNILTGESRSKFEDLYSSDAIVFMGRAKRSEPAKLAAARRMRQLADATSNAAAEIGSVDVQIAGTDVAIATYTYKFQSSKAQSDGSRTRQHTLFGRATQIFQLDPNGVLRIVHEHLSSASPSRVEKAVGP